MYTDEYGFQVLGFICVGCERIDSASEIMLDLWHDTGKPLMCLPCQLPTSYQWQDRADGRGEFIRPVTASLTAKIMKRITAKSPDEDL